jgi:hypothetical protein
VSQDEHEQVAKHKSRSAENGNRRDDRWFDLMKLVIGFMLTGVIGAWLSQMYKEREIRADAQRKQLEGATAVFYEVIDGLSKRHYFALRANAAVEQWSKEDDAQWRNTIGRKFIDDAFKVYDDNVIEWNAHRFRTKVILDTYFGDSYWLELETKVVPVFGKTKEDLDNLRDHAIDDGVYDEELHERVNDRIENEEEKALMNLCDRLSRSVQEREKPSGGFFSWLIGDSGRH